MQIRHNSSLTKKQKVEYISISSKLITGPNPKMREVGKRSEVNDR